MAIHFVKPHFYRGLFTAVILMIALHLSAQTRSTTSVEDQINFLINKMTLKEKIGMLHASSPFTSGGVKRLGIPEMYMSDGPHGVRLERGRDWDASNDHVMDSATYLPTGNTLAATWNPALGYTFGAVLGSEANYRGKDVILGPGINIIRTPLNGRNFEYLSEDPYLISKMVVGYIKGVQDQGISACVKHFLANNQEIERTSINVDMSDRALNEIYMPGFKAAVLEGKVNTAMGGYNKFRGQFCAHNEFLVNKVLKGNWGFDGIYMSDWGGVHNTQQALLYGTDIEMGSDLDMIPNIDYNKFYLGNDALAMVESGKVPVSVVDDKVRRILRIMFRTNMLGGKQRKPGAFNTKEHEATALKIAEEGIVLLKNMNNILPLHRNKIRSIAVIGMNADRTASMGGGSSQVRALYEITPLQGLKNYAENNTVVNYAQGYNVARGARADSSLIREAVTLASKADAVIFVGGLTHGYNDYRGLNFAYDAEGQDRPDMNMPFGQDEVIKALLKTNPNTIVVLMGGGPVDMTQWVKQTNAIIEAWYPGMEGGNALAKIIFGDVNPSGKLPMTFPVKLDDTPVSQMGVYPGVNGKVFYNEGIYVGYRYYDTYKVEPRFPFGHGLSYTTFAYENFLVKAADKKAIISLSLKNTGSIAGAEVLQVYVKQQQPLTDRPDKELKAFQKVFLQPGETKSIEMILSEDAFSYYDEKKSAWVIDGGKYDIMVGSSSKEIKLVKTIEL